MIGANPGPLFDAADEPRLKDQTRQVLRVLRERGSLTPREALETVGTDRLAARIYELRQAGYKVSTKREPNGNGGHHARYTLDLTV